MEGLMVVGRLIAVLALTVGPPLGWAILLNLRDRRQARLLDAVVAQVSSRDLRGRVAVRVRCGLLSPSSVVSVYVLTESPNEIWEIMTRLSGRLSPQIRLEVTGPVDRYFLATFIVEMRRRQPLPRPAQPTLATS